MGKLQVLKLLAEAWMRTATPSVAAVGFRSADINPFNPDLLPQTPFAPSSGSERPLHCNPNRGRDTASGSNNQGRSAARKVSAIGRSTSVGRSVREIMPSPKTDRKVNGPLRSLTLNATLVTKDRFESKSGKGWKLDSEQAATEENNTSYEEEKWPNLWGLRWVQFRPSYKWRLDSVHGVQRTVPRKRWQWLCCEHGAVCFVWWGRGALLIGDSGSVRKHLVF
jgi:hypothetical protein